MCFNDPISELNMKLLFAILKNDINEALTLIEYGADVNFQYNIMGAIISPIIIAWSRCDKELIELLLENGAEGIMLIIGLEEGADQESVSQEALDFVNTWL